MGILSRYIAVMWLRLLGLCLGSFVAVYLVLDMMEKIPRFLRAGGNLGDIVMFFVYKLPEMVGQTASFSILMTTLLTLGLLSRNSEVIAMRSCGVSLLRISMPMVLLSLAVCLLLLLNTEFVVPDSYERMEHVERVKIKKQGVNAVFKRNNIWFRSDNLILQAHIFEPQERMLKGVTIWELEGGMNPVRRIDAESAFYKKDKWELQKAVVKEFGKGPGFVSQRQAAMVIPIDLEVYDLKVLDNNADNLSYAKLKEYADSLQKGYRYQTMMHNKLSAPFAAFVMVILGIPFALRSSRSGGVALGIGASIAIGFAFFVVNAMLLSYGRSGVLPPVVAAWGANFVFVLGGIWLSMTVKN